MRFPSLSLIHIFDLFTGFGQVQFALQPQNDVLRGGEHIHQLEMLMDHADAVVERVFGRCV